MLTNLPVWNYYPRDDSLFIDPLYAPYVRRNIQASDGVFPVNTTERQGGYLFVRPELVRKGWSLDFQRKHAHFPCPSGYLEGSAGWCIKSEADFGDHGLYSRDSFVAKYQYPSGYTTMPQDSARRELTPFDNKSVNPHTGNFVSYYRPKGLEVRSLYGHLPSKDSLLA